MLGDTTHIGFFKAKTVVSQSDLVARAQSYLLNGSTVDSHPVRAITVNNLPAALRRRPNEGMLARNATVIENQRAGLCPANRDRPFAQEFEDMLPIAGPTNHKSSHSNLPKPRGHRN